MRIHATGSSEVKSWDEKPYSEVDGQPKFTRASVIYTYHGDLEGEGQVEYLMCYPATDRASFLGYEQVTGRLGDRSGTFVLQHLGTYENGVATTTSTVVAGSATGALSGLLGEGSAVAGHEPPASFTLDYELD